MKKFTYFFICISLLLGCRDNTNNTIKDNTSDPALEQPLNVQMANAHGFEEFDKVRQINFTFNVKVNDTLRTSRAWKWFPQEDRVELTEKNDTISYENDGDFTELEQAADKKFINDTYWLLFPFQLVWSDFEMTQSSGSEAPISKEQMHQLTISFKDEGGYTPGDTYHLFYEGDKLIKEWTYVSAGGRSLSTTWEDYEDFEGIKISTMHKSEDESFQLFFTNVEVIK